MRPLLSGAARAALAVAAACSSPRPATPPTPLRPAAAATAALTIDAHERFYDVTGATVAELRDAMRRLGPRGSDGHGDAVTVWNLEWTYGEGRPADGCALRDVRVTLAVTVTLPRWDPPRDAPRRLVDSWRRFLERVQVHEGGHRAIAERYARRLAAALTALRAPTCEAVWDEAKRTGARVVEEGRAANRAYDVETKHGQTQGVVLEQ
jgi:predicted secreted Zn-dependent protease